MYKAALIISEIKDIYSLKLIGDYVATWPHHGQVLWSA